MRRGQRVSFKDQTIMVKGESVVVPFDRSGEQKLQQVLDDIQTQMEDSNCKPGGFRPFGYASESAESTFLVEAGFNGTKPVGHVLKDRVGAPMVPNRWMVVDTTNPLTIARDDSVVWGTGLVSFKVVTTNAATVTVALWRKD